MPLDMDRFLNPTPEDRADVAANELPPLVILKDAAFPAPPKNIEAMHHEMWANFGVKVVQRLRSPDYQKLVTNALLANASPAMIANLIKVYVETGKTPWRS